MTLLTAAIPLRQSTLWGSFREAVAIPHRYGETSGALIQYDDARTQFVWADHASAGIDAVAVEGQDVGGWVWENTTDSTGHAITRVTFAQPQDEGVTIIATGRAKLHPTAGGLMTNPADVVWDILSNIAGQGVSLSLFSAFRRECEREGLFVGGSIETADSTQSIVRAVCESVGAVYCADMPGVCRLWPGGAQGPARLSLRTGDATANATVDDLANDLTMQYAYADNSPLASVQLEAPDSIAEYQRRSVILEARWLTSARVALSVGKRLLEQRARPVWLIEFITNRAIAVGDTVNLNHASLPAAGDHVVLSRALDLDTGNAAITVRAPVGSTPIVRLVRQSAAFEPAQYSSIVVATQGDQRVLTLKERTGQPIADAQVTLDGTTKRNTDASGRVSFPVSLMPLGEHSLAILTSDGRTLQSIVEVT